MPELLPPRPPLLGIAVIVGQTEGEGGGGGGGRSRGSTTHNRPRNWAEPITGQIERL